MAEVGVTDAPDVRYAPMRTAETGADDPHPARLARRLWHQRSVRGQILATFVLINVLATIVASALVVYNARRATLVEIGASVAVAERYVQAAIARLEASSGAGGIRPDRLGLEIASLRHVRVVVTTPDGQQVWPAAATAITAADDEPAGMAEAAPGWFAALVSVGVDELTRLVPVTSQGRRIATVTILGEAGDEIAEVWEDMSGLALVALAVNLAVIVVLHVALGRLLHPLRGLAAGFRELEQGHFRHRLAPPRTRELADIVDRFNALAGSLAAARADNARLSRRLVAVQDDERRQLAAELHDELGPCLFGLKANVASLSRLAERLPDDVGGPLRERADTLMDIGERIQTANRRLLKAVRPMALGHVPLAEAVAGLVAEFERHAPGCAFRLEANRLAQGYGDSLDLTVYRCVQEGLTNAVRHAGATRITVAIAERAAPEAGDPMTATPSIRLSVEDDGRGMAADARAGLGLTAMKERVTAQGGTVVLTPRPGRGTRLAVTIPLEEGDRTPSPAPTEERHP